MKRSKFSEAQTFVLKQAEDGTRAETQSQPEGGRGGDGDA